jgi:hypothetical protein
MPDNPNTTSGQKIAKSGGLPVATEQTLKPHVTEQLLLSSLSLPQTFRPAMTTSSGVMNCEREGERERESLDDAVCRLDYLPKCGVGWGIWRVYSFRIKKGPGGV